MITTIEIYGIRAVYYKSVSAISPQSHKVYPLFIQAIDPVLLLGSGEKG